MPRTIGYARVSTLQQDLDVQRAKLTAAGCAIIFEEKQTGTTAARAELKRALGVLDAGDTLVVTRLDRLGRSTRDLLSIAADLKARGVHLKATDQPIDTSSPAGELFFTLLAAFGQFEHAIRAERQAEGIAAAKAKHVYKGRVQKIDADEVRTAHASGETPTQIAKRLKISRQSVYRAIAN